MTAITIPQGFFVNDKVTPATAASLSSLVSYVQSAQTNATNAAASATAAAGDAASALASQNAAQASATSAAASATEAAAGASTATTQASNASSSATNASSSATSASTSSTNASSSASTASTDATNASSSANTASTQETNAASSASSAASSAATAGNKAANATVSATSAANSATSAAISAVSAAGAAALLGSTYYDRNLLQNGRLTNAQRGAGPWSATGWTLDRWYLNLTGTDAATVSRVALSDADRTAIGDEAAIEGLQLAVTGASGGGTSLVQPLEGTRWLSNKQLTVSFWAKASSGTPKLGIAYTQNFGTGGSPSAAVAGNVNVATLSTSWQKVSFTFTMPSTSGKTFGTTAGSDYTTLEWWFSEGGGIGVAQTATFTIWGLKLQPGSAATPLSPWNPPRELAECQRYFMFFADFSVSGYGSQVGDVLTSTKALPVTMRKAPILTIGTITATNTGGYRTGATFPDSVRILAGANGPGTCFASAPVSCNADFF